LKVSEGGRLNGSQEKQYQFKLKLRASIVFLPWPLFVSFRSRRQVKTANRREMVGKLQLKGTQGTKAKVWQHGGWNRKTFKYLNVLSSSRENL